MIVVSWQARLHLNKRVKFYSLFLGNLELGRIHIKQITRSEILRQYRKITLRVIFISYQSNCQHKKVNTHNLSASTSTTAQIFDTNQILFFQLRRYRICK